MFGNVWVKIGKKTHGQKLRLFLMVSQVAMFDLCRCSMQCNWK